MGYCKHLHKFIKADGSSECRSCGKPLEKIYRLWWDDMSNAMTAGRRAALKKAAAKKKKARAG